jgi:hypothetical protein
MYQYKDAILAQNSKGAILAGIHEQGLAFHPPFWRPKELILSYSI